jgi:hypothetical protein
VYGADKQFWCFGKVEGKDGKAGKGGGFKGLRYWRCWVVCEVEIGGIAGCATGVECLDWCRGRQD